MSNPLFDLFSAREAPARDTVKIDPQLIASAKRMMGALSAVKNPSAALEKAAGQNPTLAAVFKLCGGRDPKAVFYELCEQNGINPDDILSQLK